MEQAIQYKRYIKIGSISMQIAFRYNKEGERNKTKLPIPLKKSLTKRTRSNKNNKDCGKKHRTRAKNLKMQKTKEMYLCQNRNISQSKRAKRAYQV